MYKSMLYRLSVVGVDAIEGRRYLHSRAKERFEGQKLASERTQSEKSGVELALFEESGQNELEVRREKHLDWVEV